MRRPARPGAILLAAVLAASPSAGCASAVKHPALTAGIVAGTLGLGTCKLASDSYGTCLAIGGGAGAFLGLVTAAALWLGGDGNTVMAEEQAQPLPELEDTRPRRHRRPPDPAPADPGQPTAPAPVAPDAPSPAPPPAPAAPAPDSPSPAPVSPAPPPAASAPAP